MAVRAEKSRRFPWYDSVWLDRYAEAWTTVAREAPEKADDFVEAFRVFHTVPDFEVRRLGRVLDDADLAELVEVAGSVAQGELELHEARTFKRFVVHDHPVFTRVQAELTDLVGEAAGEAVEPNYNFLSLYGAAGVCPPHLDAPQAKWTLDLCLEQSQAWLIHISEVQPWPDPSAEVDAPADWQERIKADRSLGFKSYVQAPGEAILFSGSSQWHYRDPLPPGPGRQFSDLLFFHYIPAGSRPLLDPAGWAEIFGIPELDDIC